MAKLLTGTRIYGTANVDSVLVVGNVTSNNSTSNTTGSLIVTGGMGITGNVFMSAGNNWQSTTSSQSYRLGWTDNYFMRAAQYGGIDFTGTYLNITSTFYTSSFFYSRGLIANDSGGNNTVLFAGSSPVRLQNTAASTSNTTGSLIVGGGMGVAGNTFLNNSLAAVTTTTSAVNYLQVTGNTTSNPISLSAQGSDTDVSINLQPKGTGNVNISAANTVMSGNVYIGTTRINNDRTITNYGITSNVLGSGSGSRTIDVTLGNYVTATATGITTWTFSNPVSSPNACGFVLELINGGSATQTWPGTVRWPGGTSPTLTASGTDILVFITDDAGANWRGVASMLDSK